MSNCQDIQQKKPIDDGSTVGTTASMKPTGNGLLMTVVASTAAGIFYALRITGVGQHNALLTSTSLAWLMSLQCGNEICIFI